LQVAHGNPSSLEIESDGCGYVRAPIVIGHRTEQLAKTLAHRRLIAVGGQVNGAKGDLFGPVFGAPDRAADARLLIEVNWHQLTVVLRTIE